MATEAPSESVVWNAVLSTTLKLPGVRIDRDSFLRTAFSPHVPSESIEMAVRSTPAKAGIPKAIIERVARSAIAWHRAGVTATSTLAGLPGGWWIAGTIPADLTQFFWHVLIIAQKLAYLYGWPALLQDSNEIDDETKGVLTLFVGSMLGAQAANEGISKLAGALATEVVKRLPRAALTQFALYRIAREVAKWIGIQLTKQKFAEFVGRAVPLVGGLVAGSITWVTFGIGAKRLRTHLEGLPLAGP